MTLQAAEGHVLVQQQPLVPYAQKPTRLMKLGWLSTISINTSTRNSFLPCTLSGACCFIAAICASEAPCEKKKNNHIVMMI